MLTLLRITDLALIEDVEIELGSGLNVLTGETGAGKSVIVESIGLLVGGRATTTAIREGAERAVVEGLLSVDGEECVVRREVWRDRSNRCYLDGSMATVRTLRKRAGGQVAIHGQHEDQRLMERAAQRRILDAWAGASALAERVASATRRLEELQRERAESEARHSDREARLDYLRAQVEEIDGADLEPGEEVELESESRRLRHSQERATLAAELCEGLEGAEGSVLSLLAALTRSIDRLAGLDADVEAIARRVVDARYELEDVARELERYAVTIEHDPERLAGIEARRELLFHLRRKHGGAVEDVIECGRTMAAEIDELEHERVRGRSLDADLHRAWEVLTEAAGALADARETGADRLQASVRGRLADLGMGEGMLKVRLERKPGPEGIPYGNERFAWTGGGLEQVQFLIAPNAGEPPRPLSEIASGGELSRTLLALEAALAEADRTATLVFDEVDAGIGGASAHLVARQLTEVARHHQVIVVTHLAAIAAAADRHLMAEKSVAGGRSVTGVRPVSGEERVREVSRLLGGDPERDVSRHHAEELLGEPR